MEYFELDLQWFAEGGEAAASAGDGGGSIAADNNLPEAGEVLADGTRVDARLAAALKDQVKRHPELKERYAGARGNGQPQQAQQPAANQQGDQPGEETLEQRWEKLKKGEFKDLFGKDVKSAIDDRFKNHKDVSELEPMLKVLRQKAGVDTNEALMESVMNDDALWEEKAEELGMTIESAKEFTRMQEELEQRKQKEQVDLEQRMVQDHFRNLVQQAEQLKARIPDFDLRTELQNPEFLRMTSPEVNVPVEAAYFAVHHNEMMPQAMAMGIQRGVQQVTQTIQSGARRPAEGAMQGNGSAAAPVTIDPRSLTKAQRDEIVRQARMGKRVTFE